MGTYDKEKECSATQIMGVSISDDTPIDGYILVYNATTNQWELQPFQTSSAVFHVYCNGSTGNDANDGLSSGNPKLTIEAALDVIPRDITEHTCLHLAGTFTDEGTVYVDKHIDPTRIFLISGEEDYAVVDDNGGLHYTATNATTSVLQVSGAGWSVDEHMGYLTEILSGSAAGETRMVKVNDATDINPQVNWSVSPGVGATFDIVKPKTIFTATSASKLVISTSGPGICHVQRLSFAGSASSLVFENSTSQNSSSFIVIESSNSSENLHASKCKEINLTDKSYDVSTFALGSTERVGNSQIHANGEIKVDDCYGKVSLDSYLAIDIRINRSHFNGYLTYFGNRVKKDAILTDCTGNISLNKDTSSAIPTFENSGGVGLKFINTSLVRFDGNFEASGCSSHGIEAYGNSELLFNFNVGGIGNTGLGLYIHDKATCLLANGIVPTLTGTVGHIGTTPSTQDSTWAAISGSPLSIAAHMVLVRELP